MLALYNIILNKFSWSTRRLLFCIFLPLICLFIVVNTYLSYSVTINQLRNNSIQDMTFVIAQSRNYLDGVLGNLLSSFIQLDSQNQAEIDFCSVSPNAESFQDYLIKQSTQIDSIYFSLYDQLDSVLIYSDINNTLLYKSLHVPKSYYANTNEINDYSVKNYFWGYLSPDELPIVISNPDSKSNTLALYKIFYSKYKNSRGVIQFTFRPEYFINLLNNSDQLSNCTLLVVVGNRIVNSDFAENIALNTALSNHFSVNYDSSRGNFRFNQQGNDYLVIYDTSKISGWKIVALIPYINLQDNAKVITRLILENLFILLIISSIIISILMGMMTKPIVYLAKKVSALQDRNLDLAFSDRSFIKEINMLNSGINHLVLHVKSLLSEVKIEQEEKRKAEFFALSAQINPHFLYNTLFSVKQLCDLGNSKSASKMVMALSNFYRIGIGNDNIFNRLKNEFELIRNYMEIFIYKYDESLSIDFSINILQIFEDCLIIRMTLQPIIENAIYHGISNITGKKVINVDVVSDNDDLLISIFDNGSGFDPDKLSSINEILVNISSQINIQENMTDSSSHRSGIGIINVHKRLVMHYGNKYGIKIDSRLGEGTTIIIRIPIFYAN